MLPPLVLLTLFAPGVAGSRYPHRHVPLSLFLKAIHFRCCDGCDSTFCVCQMRCWRGVARVPAHVWVQILPSGKYRTLFLGVAFRISRFIHGGNQTT